MSTPPSPFPASHPLRGLPRLGTLSTLARAGSQARAYCGALVPAGGGAAGVGSFFPCSGSYWCSSIHAL